MKYLKNKATAFTIVTLLIISMGASLFLLPTTEAHTPAWQIPTYAYLNVTPDPVGVGQRVSIGMWISRVAPGAQIPNDIRWHNYQLSITAPDGTKTTQTWDVIVDTTSNQNYYFTPTQLGTYIINFTFPGQVYTWTMAPGFFGMAPSEYTNDTFLPSSASATLTVQEDQLAEIPTNPLPTAYWTRPIFGTNSNWWTISSNWLGTSAPGYSTGMLGGSFPGDAVGSQTAHIMWTKPLQSGGVVGGDNFVIQGDTYFEGTAYALRFTNPIIINGKLYYTEPVSFAGSTMGPTNCVDLKTGELIWSSSSIPALSFGYIYDVQDPNEHGVYPPILVATVGGSFFGPPVPLSWQCYDGDTGRALFNVTNVPAGTKMMGSQGEILIVSLVNCGTPTQPKYYLQEWNSSRLWGDNYSGPSTTPPVVPPILNGATPSLYDWNISVPSLNTLTATPTIENAFYKDMLIGEAGTFPSAGNNIFSSPTSSPYTYFGINLNPDSGTIGTVVWTNTVNPPSGNLTVSYDGADSTANTFVEYYTETMQFIGYSMNTGQKIWGPTETQASLNFFSTGYGGQGPTLAYGRLYVGGYSGIVYSYDLTNGNLLWTYGNGGEGNSTNGGLQVPRNYPTIISAIANGIVYTVTSEHTFETPIYKGAYTRAINATTGQEIWKLLSATGSPTAYAMADGYGVIDNGYDNQIYTVGRGPTATTISTPHIGLPFGSSLVIAGSVTDISVGTQQTQQAADFPNGVPVASDTSMTKWMGYVYQQQPIPTDFTGVPVTIDVLDSNGNYRNIGTTITDASGTYRLTWTPDIPGDYTVYATFAGTNGYWPSYAEDGFNVMQEPSVTPAPTTVPASMADQYFVPAIAGLFVAIIVVGALMTILLLRKRP